MPQALWIHDEFTLAFLHCPAAKLLCWQNKYVNFCWTFVVFRIGIPACGAAAFFIITSCTSILMSETSASLSVFWAGHWTHIKAFLCQREERQWERARFKTSHENVSQHHTGGLDLLCITIFQFQWLSLCRSVGCPIWKWYLQGPANQITRWSLSGRRTPFLQADTHTHAHVIE